MTAWQLNWRGFYNVTCLSYILWSNLFERDHHKPCSNAATSLFGTSQQLLKSQMTYRAGGIASVLSHTSSLSFGDQNNCNNCYVNHTVCWGGHCLLLFQAARCKKLTEAEATFRHVRCHFESPSPSDWQQRHLMVWRHSLRELCLKLDLSWCPYTGGGWSFVNVLRDVSSHLWVLTFNICSCQCWECPSVRKDTKDVGTDYRRVQWFECEMTFR